MRQTMGFLFMVIAGNFVSDFMRDAYDILYHRWSAVNLVVVMCASTFIFKQVTDCYLYYQDFPHFEPGISKVSWREYGWWVFYNAIEIQVLVFTFGGVVDLRHLDSLTGSVTIPALVRFVSAAALVEASWLAWDLAYVIQYFRKFPRRSLRYRLRAFVSDPDGIVKCARRWLPLNFLWTGALTCFWHYLETQHLLDRTLTLLVLATFGAYIASYAVVLKDYYCGVMYADRNRIKVASG